MTAPLVFTLVGIGLGAFLAVSVGVGVGSNPRAATMTLRDRAIEAQRISDRASLFARDLAARALKESR